VIENAADRVIAFLRTKQTGPHSEECRSLLNDVAAAVHCLLDPELRRAYDGQMRAAGAGNGDGTLYAVAATVNMGSERDAPPQTSAPPPAVKYATPVSGEEPNARSMILIAGVAIAIGAAAGGLALGVVFFVRSQTTSAQLQAEADLQRAQLAQDAALRRSQLRRVEEDLRRQQERLRIDQELAAEHEHRIAEMAAQVGRLADDTLREQVDRAQNELNSSPQPAAVPKNELNSSPQPAAVQDKEGGDNAPTPKLDSTEVSRCLADAAAEQPLLDSFDIRLKRIPAGSFLMGSDELDPDAQASERPRREVEIGGDFLMGQYEITVKQFQAFVDETGYKTTSESASSPEGGWGYNRARRDFERPGKRYSWRNTGFPQRENHPVCNLSWHDAVAYCDWLTTHSQHDLKYRLPTEAEWEYACRAGTTTSWPFGSDPQRLRRMGNIADGSLKRSLRADTIVRGASRAVEWNDGFAFSSPVGSFETNPLGLHDMLGNVAEWCADEFLPYDASTPPANRSGERVFRGGSWGYGVAGSRSAARGHFAPTDRWANIGFRVAADAPAP
jgi:formylglycine-generating enzyme required for sulfatase activity